MHVSVFGLGKLGLCTAACFAARGHKVWGFDANPAVMAALQARQNPIRETGLDDLLAQAWPNLEVTHDINAMVRETEISLIIVPTPSQPDGRFNNGAVAAVLGLIGPVLRDKASFHVVDVVSTVMPGSSDGIFKPLLEELSGRVCGRDFGLIYNPEFIALGSVIENFLNPDLVLIGASDERSRDVVQELYRSTCANSPHMAGMGLINAEITKLSLNAYITMKISFANELAGLCQQVPGADVDVITAAIGADSRIGPKCLMGGLGFGGPCFPRDNAALQAFAREVGHEAKLSPQVVTVNNAVLDDLFWLVTSHTPKNGQVALLGMSYKPDTSIVEESQSIKLAQHLVQAGFTVRVHDPQALAESRLALQDLVQYYDDPAACLAQADAIVLLTNWPQYSKLPWHRLGNSRPTGSQPVLVDSWRLLKGHKLKGFHYLCLGQGPAVSQES